MLKWKFNAVAKLVTRSFTFIAITHWKETTRGWANLYKFNNLIMAQFIGRLWSLYRRRCSPYFLHKFLWRQGGHHKHYHSKQWFCRRREWNSLGSGAHRRRESIRTSRRIYRPLMATVILNASIKCDYLCECELYQKYSFSQRKTVERGGLLVL